MKLRRRVRSAGQFRRPRVELFEKRQLLASDVVISDTGDPDTFVREFDSIGLVATYRPTVLQQGNLNFARIPASVIQDDLNLGISVVVVTEEVGSTDPGTIRVESNVLPSVNGATDLKFEADFDVIIAPNVSIAGIGLNIVLNSDRDQDGSGAVSVESGSRIDTRFGNITIGGGLDPTTTPSFGSFSPLSRPGVLIDGELLVDAGDISIVGAGATQSLFAIEFGQGAQVTSGVSLAQGDIVLRATTGTTNLPNLAVGALGFEAMQLVVFGGLTIDGINDGSFVVEADLNLDSTASLILDFNGAVSTNFDRLTVDGAVELGGSNVVLNGAVGSEPNQRLRIIDNISSSPTTGNFAGLPEGATVSIGGTNFTISYVAGDGNDVELTKVLSTPVQAGNQSQTIAEDSGSLSIDLSTLVTGGNASAFSFSVLSGEGMLSGSLLSFNPAANFFGSEVVNYQVTDGATTDDGTVTFNVTPINDPPVAVDDSVTIAQASQIRMDVLANDNAGPGPTPGTFEADTLSVIAVSVPSSGIASIQPDGSVLYTSAQTFTGTDSFSYTVSDGQFTSTGVVSVNVTATGVDLAISKSAGSASVFVGGSLSYTLMTSFVSGSAPSSGRFVVRDVLPPGLTFVDASAPGSVSAIFNSSTRELVIEYLSLSVGESATAVVNTTVLTGSSALLINTATVSTLDVTDINPGNDSASTLVQVSPASPSSVDLTTGAGDGDLVIRVDPLGNFGSARTGLNSYNPVGPALASSAVFASALAVRSAPSGTREFLDSSTVISQANASFMGTGSGSSVVSTFSLLGLNVELTQTVSPTFNASQQRLGAQLTQTYRVSNPLSASQTLDLVRYFDGDLAFDGSIDDAGGFVFDASGGLTLFETDLGGSGAIDTTFVGVADGGDGTIPSSDRFMLRHYLDLRNQIANGDVLLNSVEGDNDNNGFVDPGEEYDIGLALRRLLTVPALGSVQYTTTTTFGGAPVDTAAVTGHVFCDANGDGIETSNEIAVGATVFIDLNRNGILESSEPTTLTDSAGNYRFDSLPSGLQVVTLRVPDGCDGLPRRFASVPSPLSIGQVVRDVIVTDVDGDGRDEVLGVGEQNSELVILSPGSTALQPRVISLPSRPQAIDVWRSFNSSGATSTIAVASVSGGPQGRGAVTLIEGSTTRTIEMGHAPIDVVLDDFNGDGLPDVVVAAYQSNNYQLLLSGSSSVSSSPTPSVLASGDAAYRVESGDFDGDGQVDLALASYGYSNSPGSMRILFGNGDGTFELGPSISLTGKPLGLVAGNFSSPDSGDELAVLVNDVASSAPGSDPQLANPSEARSRVLTYSVSRTAARDLGSPVVLPAGASHIKAGDANFDGLEDLAVVRSGAGTIDLLLGNGLGSFIAAKSSAEAGSVINAAFGDVDGTGRAGLLVAANSSNGFSLPGTTLLKLGVDTVPVNITGGAATRADFSPTTRLDADGNGVIDAVDAVRIINSLNTPSSAIAGEPLTGSIEVTLDDPMDVNGDGRRTALDALWIINHLNERDSQAAVQRDRLEAKRGAWEGLFAPESSNKLLREADVDEAFQSGGLF